MTQTKEAEAEEAEAEASGDSLHAEIDATHAMRRAFTETMRSVRAASKRAIRSSDATSLRVGAYLDNLARVAILTHARDVLACADWSLFRRIVGDVPIACDALQPHVCSFADYVTYATDAQLDALLRGVSHDEMVYYCVAYAASAALERISEAMRRRTAADQRAARQ